MVPLYCKTILFTAWPFLGSRRMARLLSEDGRPVNRKRVQRLMRRKGIAALGPKPRTSTPAPGHRIYPYLLCGDRATEPSFGGGRHLHSDRPRVPSTSLRS